MRFWQRIFRGKREWESELDEELRFHLEKEIAANIAAGMPDQEARRQAVLRLGGVDGLKEACREQRRGARLTSLWQDLRYGLRMLRKILRSPPPLYSRWPSASAPTLRYSALSMPFCSGPCQSKTPRNSSC